MLSLDRLVGKGRQAGEMELDMDAKRKLSRRSTLIPASQPEFNTTAMSQLEAMGFPTIRCQKALLATGNSDAEIAMTWLFEHMEDPGERCLQIMRDTIAELRH